MFPNTILYVSHVRSYIKPCIIVRNGRVYEPQEFSLWMWTHPPASGLALVSGLAVLISLVKFSLISVVSHTLLSVLLIGVAARVYVHLMGFLKKPCTDPLDNVRDIEVTLPTEQVEAFVTNTAEQLNTVASSLKSLILVENVVESIKFGVLMYVLFLASSPGCLRGYLGPGGLHDWSSDHNNSGCIGGITGYIDKV